MSSLSLCCKSSFFRSGSTGRGKDTRGIKTFSMAATLFIVLWISALQSHAQRLPVRAGQAVEALQAAETDQGWNELRVGLHALQATSASGARLHAFKFDQSKYRFHAALHADVFGDRVNEVGKREGAIFAINGGFFSEQSGVVKAVGALRISRQTSGSRWRTRGGYLTMQNGIASITPSGDGPPITPGDYIQSMPLILEPGGIWALNTNIQTLKRRTIVCTGAKDFARNDDDQSQPPNDTVVVLIVSGSGLSLYEAGWTMRPREQGGFFGCDAALAMDGGGSTQYWMRDLPEYSLRGATPVHNFVIVKERN